MIFNPEEYAKVCKCSLELAEKRCSYFNNLYNKLLHVVCPSCKADYTKLQYKDDGKNENAIFFIECIDCNERFFSGDSRLRDWVASFGLFDQVVDVIKYGKSSVMGFEPGDLTEEEWIQFVTESIGKRRVLNGACYWTQLLLKQIRLLTLLFPQYCANPITFLDSHFFSLSI